MDKLERYDDAPRPVKTLLRNRAAASLKAGREVLYTPPSSNVIHYPHLYRWDSALAGITYAKLDYPRLAVEEIYSLFEGQRQDGFIPNQRFAPDGRKYDWERMFFMKWEESSDYDQPPLEALLVFETFHSLMRQDEARRAELLVEDIWPKLVTGYRYFELQRQNSPEDPLVGVPHPHATGRDSDPTFDFFKLRLSRQGTDTSQRVNEINRITDYTSAVALSALNRLNGWRPEKIRKYFWVNDVMFNCVYADNLYRVADLAIYGNKLDDWSYFRHKARGVEEAILGRMWFRQARDGQGAFYSLNKDGQAIEVDSVGNLCALLLPNLGLDQLEVLLTQIDEQFNTPYPLPSVATDSPEYDPHYGEHDRLWRGPVWIALNFLVHRGLMIQAKRPNLTNDPRLPILQERCRLMAERIAASSKALTENEYAEFSDPGTREPYRFDKSPDFSMSTLADTM